MHRLRPHATNRCESGRVRPTAALSVTLAPPWRRDRDRGPLPVPCKHAASVLRLGALASLNVDARAPAAGVCRNSADLTTRPRQCRHPRAGSLRNWPGPGLAAAHASGGRTRKARPLRHTRERGGERWWLLQWMQSASGHPGSPSAIPVIPRRFPPPIMSPIRPRLRDLPLPQNATAAGRGPELVGAASSQATSFIDNSIEAGILLGGNGG